MKAYPSNGHNKIAFAVRIHERRLREIERRLGIVSPQSPLENTTPNLSGCMDAAESKEPKHATERFPR